MIRGILVVVVLLMIFAAKSSYQGRVFAVLIALGLLFWAKNNKNLF